MTLANSSVYHNNNVTHDRSRHLFLQLQAHLQELTAAAVRAHFDGCAHVHPHAVEAARQVTGELVRQGGETDLFPGPAQPQLLHEPYMSASGAAGLLSQTLVDVAAKLDREAEARGTLESPEFQAFHALVSSVYVGSLQTVSYTHLTLPTTPYV